MTISIKFAKGEERGGEGWCVPIRRVHVILFFGIHSPERVSTNGGEAGEKQIERDAKRAEKE